MTQPSAPVARYRKDYRAPAFTIKTVDLTIALDPTKTLVTNVMRVQRLEKGEDLQLDGEQLSLLRLEVNGEVQAEGTDYIRSPGKLTLLNLSDDAEIKVVTQINPSKNTALEGLYLSGGSYCTQCEAEGFRRITYFLDRPDVLSVFTTTVIGPKTQFPHLLSNGNKVTAGSNDNGEHWVTWHDPHPKPCYLFALVAGDFDCLTDSYVTAEGRRVSLELFVDKGNLDRAEFAMESLKNSMRWDEERFGLVYDLDIYMIVAVDFFNMGAMENKGLNIFNAKYVLANPETATDQDFLNVESVIGHEYFHNWTGNRITCRDWFQLSLKEGLTVFRDQEFSADRGMRDVNRIQDVRIMRTHQFDEDAGPMAHPIRPDKVVEMNNFYTVTVYNKGAEVIRMMHTLLGEEGFQAGMREYVRRHDGQAVTCEDFILAMEAANSRDFNQFRRWYEQAGTPRVRVLKAYDAKTQQLTLTVSQQTPATPGQPSKEPFHIPMRIELMVAQGEQAGHALMPPELPESGVLEITETQQRFVFSGIADEPLVGCFADFSAPVKMDIEESLETRILLTAHAKDAFLRWNAIQDIYMDLLQQSIGETRAVRLPALLVETLQKALLDTKAHAAMTALLLQLPSEESVAGEFDCIPVEAITKATKSLHLALAQVLSDALLVAWQRCFNPEFEFNAAAVSNRMLCNTCLYYLAALPAGENEDAIAHALEQQFQAKASMTLVFGALQAAVHQQHPKAPAMLATFAENWSSNTLVMDKWLAVQATAVAESTVENVRSLQKHPSFDWGNPNRIYALLASFSHNQGQLHRADGAGYRLLRDAIERLNNTNPQVASRLLSSLLKWKRLEPKRQQLLKSELDYLRDIPQLAPDLFEKIEQSLAE